MIKGMTGFGSAPLSTGRTKGVFEIKSQNHRYLDVVYYLPVGFSSLESRIQEVLGKEISRGRVTVSLKITDKNLQQMTFNKDAVKEYLKCAKNLEKEFGLENNLSLADLIKMPGVVQVKEISLNAEELWPDIEKSLGKTLHSLVRMREREGGSLAADISRVLKRMAWHVKNIEARTKIIFREKKKGLSSEEIVSLQKGNDINEELSRLKHYIEETKLLLKAGAGAGKKLDFVAQEMQRETNTIGSKVQDGVVSNAVIALKGKIEKLREQAQNIE
jgi:uncharacterized protein (TIGR00255 family)